MNMDHHDDHRDDHDGALEAAVDRFLTDRYPFSPASARGVTFDDGRWQSLHQQGWLGWILPEAAGGLGQPAADAFAIVEALGRHGVQEPFVESVLRPLAVLSADDPRLVAVAAADAPRSIVIEGPLRLERQGAVSRLRAPPLVVRWATQAGRAIVGADAPEGFGWWAIDLRSPGATGRTARDADDAPMAEVLLDGLVVGDDNRLCLGQEALRRRDILTAVDIAAACADALGAMAALQAETVDYLKLREQFGKPLAAFQALQHRLADMFVQIELARSMSAVAVEQASQALAGQAHRPLRSAAAKAQVAQACRFVGEQSVQLHGGIGMTDECRASHRFRRLLALERRGGGRHRQLGRLAQALQRGEGLFDPA